MAARVEIAGVDRTNPETRDLSLAIDARIDARTTCRLTMQSLDASWRPGLEDRVRVWEPYRAVTDGAITTSTMSLTSATAVFVAGDVGRDVIVAGAGPSGAALLTTIAARVSATEVTLTSAASTSVTGAAVQIGVVRFAGYVWSFREKRVGANEGVAGTREYAVSCVDAWAYLDRVAVTGSRSSEGLRTRLDWIIDTYLTDDYGITLDWAITDDGVLLETGDDLLLETGDRFLIAENPGPTLDAAVYAGDRASTVITRCIDEATATSGDLWIWYVTRLLTIRAHTVSSTYSATPAALSDLDTTIRRDEVEWSMQLGATGGRRVTLLTWQDGFRPGQVGSIELDECGCAAENYLIESVRASYTGWTAQLWQWEITAVQAAVTGQTWVKYFQTIYGV